MGVFCGVLSDLCMLLVQLAGSNKNKPGLDLDHWTLTTIWCIFIYIYIHLLDGLHTATKITWRSMRSVRWFIFIYCIFIVHSFKFSLRMMMRRDISIWRRLSGSAWPPSLHKEGVKLPRTCQADWWPLHGGCLASSSLPHTPLTWRPSSLCPGWRLLSEV